MRFSELVQIEHNVFMRFCDSNHEITQMQQEEKE